MKTLIVPALLALSLTGCGTAPLMPITYDKEPTFHSELDTHVQLNTGVATGHGSSTLMLAGNIFVPINTGPVPALQFGAEDQEVFITSLEQGLIRKRIFQAISEKDSEDIPNIIVNFVHTEHFPNFQEYKLTVSMELRFGSEISAHRYEVLSSEGDSTWEKWNTSASDGKKKAATKLLNLMMTDIQNFMRRALENDQQNITDAADSFVAPYNEPRDWSVLPSFADLRAEIGWGENFSEKCEQNALEDETAAFLDDGKYREAVNSVKEWLGECPISITGHYYAMIAYGELGEIEEGRPHYNWYQGLINSILESGDGKSSETAYVTISIDEEYAVLHYLELTSSEQALIKNPPRDLLTVTDKSGNKFGVWFNPAAHFARLAKWADEVVKQHGLN